MKRYTHDRYPKSVLRGSVDHSHVMTFVSFHDYTLRIGLFGREKIESTDFKGDHVVECYAIKDGIVVAKDRIHVPITTNAGKKKIC